MALSEPAWNSSIRILIKWGRPYFTIEASAQAWADLACAIVRPGHGPRPAGRPGTIGVHMDRLLMLHMPAAVRGGRGGRHHGNRHQRARVQGKCQKPDRKPGHAPLLLNPVWRPTDRTPRRNKHSRAITPVCNSLQATRPGMSQRWQSGAARGAVRPSN